MRCGPKENTYWWIDHDKLAGTYKMCVFLFQEKCILNRWVAMHVNGVRVPVLLEFCADGRGGDGKDSGTAFRTKPRRVHFLWCVNTPDNIKEEASQKREYHGPRWSAQEWAEYREYRARRG